jgi:hypothetical protein
MAEGWHFITAVELARQMYDTLMRYAMGPEEIVVNKPQETVDD